MANQSVIRCSYCKKIYFDLGQEKCPFCQRNQSFFGMLPPIFEDLSTIEDDE